jgi:hypothetical protein
MDPGTDTGGTVIVAGGTVIVTTVVVVVGGGSSSPQPTVANVTAAQPASTQNSLRMKHLSQIGG